MDEKELSIEEKLLAIQTSIKCGKNLKNNFGGFKYRNTDIILEALKPYLKSCGLTIRLDDELKYIGERYYIEAKAILTDVKTKECIVNKAYAREEKDRKGMDASQITGSSSSYARKYALSGLLALDEGRDADSMMPMEENPVDEETLKKCHDMSLENVKDEIRTVVENMSESDPNLAGYQKVLYAVLGEEYTKFKVGDCTEEQKDVLDNILARLIQPKA